MKAVILAAGRGSRLKNLTNDKPKGMVSLCGRSLVERMMDSLCSAGLRDIAIVTGYRKESFDFLKILTFHNPEWETTNMVLSLACAREWLNNEPVLVCYSDIFVPSNGIVDLVKARGNLCVLYDKNWLELWKDRTEDPLDDAETFRLEGKRITEIGQKPKAIEDIQGQYMGLLKFTPQAWKSYENILSGLEDGVRRKISMTEMLQLMIDSGVSIEGVPFSEMGEVDTESDLRLYEEKATLGAYAGWF